MSHKIYSRNYNIPPSKDHCVLTSVMKRNKPKVIISAVEDKLVNNDKGQLPQEKTI